MSYKRINKPTARKMYNHGCNILLLPCKVNDSAVDGSHPWVKPVTINISDCKHDAISLIGQLMSMNIIIVMQS